MKKFFYKIEDFLIYLLIIVTSFQGIFQGIFSLADEILILFFIIIELFKFVRGKRIIYSKKRMIFICCIVVFLLMECLFNMIFNNFIASFIDIIYYFKVIIVLEMFKLTEINNERTRKFINFFCIVNIISILWGIVAFKTNLNLQIGVSSKVRNGTKRVGGLSGHPITMALSGLCIIICCSNFEKGKKFNNIIRIICIIISFYGIYLSQSRLVIVFGIIFIILKKYLQSYEKINKIVKHIINCIFLLVTLIILLVGYNNIIKKSQEYLSDDIENTIRMHSLQKSLEVIKQYPIGGTGIGTFGSRDSVKNGSKVYNEFGFKQSFVNMQYIQNLNVFESYFAYIIIQSGMAGLLLYILLFYGYFKNIRKNKNYISGFLCFFYIINCFFNQGYQLPFIILLAICLSNDEFNCKKIENERMRL